jgi:hypothetical protein
LLPGPPSWPATATATRDLDMGVRLAIEVANIVWDTDGETIDGLPETMSFEVDLPEDEPSETEINEAATSHMSDETGWCVESFSNVQKVDVSSTPAP